MREYRFKFRRESTGSVAYSTCIAESALSVVCALRSSPEFGESLKPGGEGWELVDHESKLVRPQKS